MGLPANSLLHACKVCVRFGRRHSPLHRRWQVGLVLMRRKRAWSSPLAQRLVAKYGAVDA